MNTEKYKVGDRILFRKSNIAGTVVENFKLPGDICVVWDTGQKASYDEAFLDTHCERAP